MSDTDRRDRMTYTLPEAAIRAAGHALRTRTGVDFDGWDGEAEIALRAALPHLQPRSHILGHARRCATRPARPRRPQ